MTPSFNLIAMVVVRRVDTSVEGLRFGHDDRARAAKHAFAWLADQMSDAGHAAAALWLGVSEASLWQFVKDAEEARCDQTIAEQLDDIALEIWAEHLTREKLGKLRPERRNHDVARAMLKPGSICSVEEMRALAAGYLALTAMLAEERTKLADERAQLALVQEMSAQAPQPSAALVEIANAVVAANRRLELALYTPGERAARAALVQSLSRLSSHPELKQEPARG